MKGIILAGGYGTRLYPLTNVVSKQLLPVFDKPMIYYPMSILMLAEIRDILIISDKTTLPLYSKLFGSGENLGLNISYAVQDKPNGIPEAFTIGREFIGNDKVCLILGDNIFFGSNFSSILKNAQQFNKGGVIFGYRVPDPHRFGVVELTAEGKILKITEKPKIPKSNIAVTGLYYYDNDVIEITSNLKPSSRGELEITDINNFYLRSSNLQLQLLGRGFSWLDSGTPESLFEAGQFIKTTQSNQKLYVASLEEIAFNKKYISLESFISLIDQIPKSSDYYKYLKGIAIDN